MTRLASPLALMLATVLRFAVSAGLAEQSVVSGGGGGEP